MLKLPAVLTHAIASEFFPTVNREVLSAPNGLVPDVGGLQQSASAAPATLLACRRQALAAGKTFSVLGAPERLLQLAGVYGVAQLFPATESVLPVS